MTTIAFSRLKCLYTCLIASAIATSFTCGLLMLVLLKSKVLFEHSHCLNQFITVVDDG